MQPIGVKSNIDLVHELSTSNLYTLLVSPSSPPSAHTHSSRTQKNTIHDLTCHLPQRLWFLVVACVAFQADEYDLKFYPDMCSSSEMSFSPGEHQWMVSVETCVTHSIYIIYNMRWYIMSYFSKSRDGMQVFGRSVARYIVLLPLTK